jgi:hypothetical protein
MSEYKEQYQKSNNSNNKELGMTSFLEIANKFKHFFKSFPDNKYLENFCRYGVKFSNTSPDKFRRALESILEHQDTFPSISDLRIAIEKLPRRPIDYIASNKQDSRQAIGCARCDHLGWVRAMSEDLYETVCLCPECKGNGLTANLPTQEQVLKRGYTKLKLKRGS